MVPVYSYGQTLTVTVHHGVHPVATFRNIKKRENRFRGGNQSIVTFISSNLSPQQSHANLTRYQLAFPLEAIR